MTEGKTLAELDVKPGDVVRYDNLEYEVMHPDGHPWLNVTRIWGKRGSCDNWIDETCPYCTIVSRAEPDTPKTWGEMSDAEKGALLLGAFNKFVIEWHSPPTGNWCECGNVIIGNFADGIAYRIKPPSPVRETVTLTGIAPTFFNASHSGCDTHSITFTTIDGKPDCASIKMEAIGDE